MVVGVWGAMGGGAPGFGDDGGGPGWLWEYGGAMGRRCPRVWGELLDGWGTLSIAGGDTEGFI